MKQYIAYYRVSTKEQGDSGLGLAAQQATVTAYARNATILAHYTDIESGKSNTRSGLLQAIEHAKKGSATLCIAKLDRLSRDVQFIATLMNTGVAFECCDMPQATSLTIHIFAAMAEHERKLIGSRTKAALDELKKQGVKLGKPENLTAEGRQKGGLAAQAAARNNTNTKQARLVAGLLRKQGCTLEYIMNELNASGMKTARGTTFRLEQVRRLLKPIPSAI